MSPPLLVALNIRAGFVFGTTALPFLFYYWFFLPETKGLVIFLTFRLEWDTDKSRRAAAEIDELFERKIPAWRWATTETAIEHQMREAVLVRGVPGGEPNAKAV